MSKNKQKRLEKLKKRQSCVRQQHAEVARRIDLMQSGGRYHHCALELQQLKKVKLAKKDELARIDRLISLLGADTVSLKSEFQTEAPVSTIAPAIEEAPAYSVLAAA